MCKKINSPWYRLTLFLTVALVFQTATAAERLKIAYGSPWVGWGPLYIAQQKGYFEAEGLDVEISHQEHGFDLLKAGEVDGYTSTLDEATLHWQSQKPYAVMLAADVSAGGDGVLIRNDRNIGSVADLKAKKIGLWLNTPSHFLLNYLLQQAGMSEKDVTLIDLRAEDAAAAVVAGDVDAAVTWNPYLGKAAADPKVDLLITSKDTPGLIADALAMDKNRLAAKPETCRALVRAWNKAVEYQKANPDEAAAIVAKGLDYGSADNVKADLAGIELQGRDENARFFSGTGPGTAQATAAFAIDLWTKAGRLTTPVTVHDLIDDRCLEK
jgi:NitT/TauT family transport system substrate-binding protein